MERKKWFGPQIGKLMKKSLWSRENIKVFIDALNEGSFSHDDYRSSPKDLLRVVTKMKVNLKKKFQLSFRKKKKIEETGSKPTNTIIEKESSPPIKDDSNMHQETPLINDGFHSELH